MCGIVGYVGPRVAAPVLLEGLKRLEYRGYDSAGLAIHTARGVEVARSVGKLDNLSRALGGRKLDGTVGVAHTRWATHGQPSESNTHPHVSGDVAVVHNGIIENHVALRRELEAEGVHIASDTDTEIVAHLVRRELDAGRLLFDAVRAALSQVHGAYALAVLSARQPDRIIVAKSGSPLVVGLGDGETLCASDMPALLAHTRDVLFLEDGELAELTTAGARVETLTGTPVTRPTRRVDWSPAEVERAGYRHFMLKEIFEQPRAVEDTLRGRVRVAAGDIEDAEMGLDPRALRGIERVCFVGCGTSYHASIAGRYWVEEIARLPAQVELASEVRSRSPVFSERDLVVAVSQSGETADTLAAVQLARDAGACVLAIANVAGGAIPLAADGTLYTRAGPEVSLPSTKSFTAELAALLLLSLYLANRRGVLDERGRGEALRALLGVPAAMRRTLERSDEVFEVARRFQHARNVLFLGRGYGYPIALEGALKLKEVSYVHAEGYAAAELRHGPMALIDDQTPVVMVIPRDRHYERTLANLQDVRARGAHVIAVASDGDEIVASLAEHVVKIPEVPELVQPLLAAIPLQLLAYYVADIRGTDIDRPRNLSKVVGAL